MKKDGLSTIVKELENASKMHLRQSKEIKGHIDDMKSPASRASKDWIQGVTKDIKARGTEGVCTGDKYGSDSCPPGSKRYNLATTFKKMNK